MTTKKPMPEWKFNLIVFVVLLILAVAAVWLAAHFDFES